MLVIKKYKLLDFENWDSAYVCIVTFFWQFRNGIVGPSSGKFHILSAGYLRWEFIKEKQENTLSTKRATKKKRKKEKNKENKLSTKKAIKKNDNGKERKERKHALDQDSD